MPSAFRRRSYTPEFPVKMLRDVAVLARRQAAWSTARSAIFTCRPLARGEPQRR